MGWTDPLFYLYFIKCLSLFFLSLFFLSLFYQMFYQIIFILSNVECLQLQGQLESCVLTLFPQHVIGVCVSSFLKGQK